MFRFGRTPTTIARNGYRTTARRTGLLENILCSRVKKEATGLLSLLFVIRYENLGAMRLERSM